MKSFCFAWFWNWFTFSTKAVKNVLFAQKDFAVSTERKIWHAEVLDTKSKGNEWHKAIPIPEWTEQVSTPGVESISGRVLSLLVRCFCQFSGYQSLCCEVWRFGIVIPGSFKNSRKGTIFWQVLFFPPPQVWRQTNLQSQSLKGASSKTPLKGWISGGRTKSFLGLHFLSQKDEIADCNILCQKLPQALW